MRECDNFELSLRIKYLEELLITFWSIQRQVRRFIHLTYKENEYCFFLVVRWAVAFGIYLTVSSYAVVYGTFLRDATNFSSDLYFVCQN